VDLGREERKVEWTFVNSDSPVECGKWLGGGRKRRKYTWMKLRFKLRIYLYKLCGFQQRSRACGTFEKIPSSEDLMDDEIGRVLFQVGIEAKKGIPK
jgi:hypothetical protein